MFGLLQITILDIFWKWEPLLDSPNFAISGRISTIFFLQIGQNSTQSPNILSTARFGLAFSHKSKKGDFLLKTQLSDLTKSIFGEP